jgi:hypothetical protein
MNELERSSALPQILRLPNDGVAAALTMSHGSFETPQDLAGRRAQGFANTKLVVTGGFEKLHTRAVARNGERRNGARRARTDYGHVAAALMHHHPPD